MDKAESSISSFSVIVVFVCLAIIGIALIPLLSIQLFPSAEKLGLTVSYSWPNVSARVMEQEVTAKLEGLFASVKGIQGISSVSSKGYGRINLTFKKNVNRDAVRFEIASLLRQCHPELPDEVSYPDLSMNATGDGVTPIMTFAVNASGSPFFISKYLEKEIIPQLSRIKGVDELRLLGATPYEMDVKFKTEHIRALAITGEDIAMAINRHFKKDLVGKGTYRQSGQEYLKELSVQLRYNLSDTLIWEEIPVKKTGDRMLYLKDLAKVRYKEQTPSSYYRINGLNTINLAVYAEKGVNNILLAKSVLEEVQRLRQSLEPGYSILLVNDSTEYLVKEINKIIFRTMLSLVILMAFVFIVSRQWRYLVLILITVAVNLLISCIFFYFFEIELELYSLAGLAISLGIMIDNSIIMINHFRNTGDRKVLLPVFAATVTTIVALAVIFLLSEEEKRNLIYFSWTIIISLSVSVAVAYFFVPALMHKIKLSRPAGKRVYRRRKAVIKFTNVYERSITLFRKYKFVSIVLLIGIFGIPVHWLPDKVEGDTPWGRLYNEVFGGATFREDIRPILERVLGGSFRLFTVYVFESSYYPEPGKTILHVNGSMPEGCTVQQLNEAVEEMENFISQFEEVELFLTSVSSYRSSNIEIHFKREHESTIFPFVLKGQLESKAINLGGAHWRVYGVGQAFSNIVYEGNKTNRIVLTGYNYEQLYQYAESLRESLLSNARIKEVDIYAGESGGNIMHEFFVSFNARRMAGAEISLVEFYNSLKDRSYRRELNSVYFNEETRRVYLTSEAHGFFNVWDFNHDAVETGDKVIKMGKLASIEKRKSGNDIVKYDQEYQLTVAYHFIGPPALSELVQKRQIRDLNEILPLGFSVRSQQFNGWNKENKTQYYLIFLVIAAIYFICAILLESLLQPLAIIAMIPISFVGVFLTFYLFHLNFDQGGFASFILLSGLSVNAALYILNDYNNLRRKNGGARLKLYLRAHNHKIIPVILTVVSTILGLLPFVIEGQKEIFWFAFACGTIGGLAFSIVGILIYLPIFIKDLK